MFILPTGASGKKYIDETMRLLNLWVNNTPYVSIAIKAVHVMMPALLPQKLSELRTSRKTNKATIIRMKGELINYYMKVTYRRPFESS